MALLAKEAPSARPPRHPLSWALIHADSTLLWARAILRRLRRLGLAGVAGVAGTGRPCASQEVVYLDIGTHTAARELTLLANEVLPRMGMRHRAFAFEANADSLLLAADRFTRNPRVSFVHAAVCGSVPASGHVRLFLHGDGHGDSLHRDAADSVEVPALRLSDWLRQQAFGADTILLLRMNIEGAEPDVLGDLRRTGWLQRISGFYGMWDDLSKLDEAADRAFRAQLRADGIRSFTFNERDFVSPWRVAAIAYDLRTSVLSACRVGAPGD